jgi:hypothetical protein
VASLGDHWSPNSKDPPTENIWMVLRNTPQQLYKSNECKKRGEQRDDHGFSVLVRLQLQKAKTAAPDTRKQLQTN